MVGGVLVSTVGWRSIFWVNIPVGIAAIVLTAIFVPESRAPRARRFDPVGQLLVIVTLATLVLVRRGDPLSGRERPRLPDALAEVTIGTDVASRGRALLRAAAWSISRRTCARSRRW